VQLIVLKALQRVADRFTRRNLCAVDVDAKLLLEVLRDTGRGSSRRVFPVLVRVRLEELLNLLLRLIAKLARTAFSIAVGE
jgi:hypothetical protein